MNSVCIRFLKPLTIDAEVFVVDNNSVDGSVALIKQKFPKVKLIANNVNTGFSVANNQAIKLATGKYIYSYSLATLPKTASTVTEKVILNVHEPAGRRHYDETVITINFTIK